jgi:hypothetical protein
MLIGKGALLWYRIQKRLRTYGSVYGYDEEKQEMKKCLWNDTSVFRWLWNSQPSIHPYLQLLAVIFPLDSALNVSLI